MRKFEFEGQKNVSGDRIRELRLRARLSQAALAAKMQTEGVVVEQDVISRIESGSRLVTDYELLALRNAAGNDPAAFLPLAFPPFYGLFS